MEESDTSSSEEEEDEVDGSTPGPVLTASKAAEEPAVKEISQPLSGTFNACERVLGHLEKFTI